MGLRTGSVTMASPSPETQTFCSAHSGSTFNTGSSSWNRPRSQSCIRAMETTGLVIE